MIAVLGFLFLTALSGCKTKSEIRREQEFEKLRQEMLQSRGDRVDTETVLDDFKLDITKLGNRVEEYSIANRREMEELKNELLAIKTRLEALEQHEVSEDQALSAPPKPSEKTPRGYEAGRRFFEEGRYEEAIEALKGSGKKKGEEYKKSLFLLAEVYFITKDYASAAIEFGEFKKHYPRDSQVALATYRQANCFRQLGKNKEARLFYQEVIDRFPKSSYTQKSKQEMKRLK